MFRLIEEKIQFPVLGILTDPATPGVGDFRLKPLGQTQEFIFLEIFNRTLDFFNGAH